MDVSKGSKKRGFLPTLSELTNFHGKKKKELFNDERKISEVSEDELDISDMSTASSSTDTGETGSSCDDIHKISRKQRSFAKMSVLRDKRKEKEKREKIDKNRISMQDFLSKHAEFCVWLEEEKHKCMKKISSPKLKNYFKGFMKLWNKRKLPLKYYRGSTDSESPCPTYVARGFSFDDEEIFDVKKFCKPKSKRLSIETTNVADSPFSTFGKTPPKLLPITSLQKLNHVVENGNRNLSSLTENNEQLISEYQVPVKQWTESGSDHEGNKENSASGVDPYYVTTYPWADDTPRIGINKESDLTSDQAHFQDIPVYAQPEKRGKKNIVIKSDMSKPSQNSPPPIPPVPKFFGNLTETEHFTSDVDYKSVDMDVNLPPPPPPMDQCGDDALMNATLPPPPPPMDQCGDDELMNATLPSPPIQYSDDISGTIDNLSDYAEIRCPEGEWKPPSKSKVYSPRKFKLAKSTSKERIYTEIPPPVAPKPKQKLFRGSVYTSEENMYIEMKKSISNCGTKSYGKQTPVLYSDYAVPVDVIDTDFHQEQLNNNKNKECQDKIFDKLEYLQEYRHNQQMGDNNSNSFKAPSVINESSLSNSQKETSAIVENIKPFVFRTSGKGCSDLLGDLNNSTSLQNFTTLTNVFKTDRRAYEERSILETDIDTDTHIEQKTKAKMTRTKSAETIIW